MRKSRLASVVQDFLGAPETDAELIRRYLSDLQSQNEQLIRRFNLDCAAVALLMIFFLLISAKGVGEFSLLGVKITQYSWIAVAIPPAVAGALARLVSVAFNASVVRQVYFEITRQAYPALWRSGLDDLVVPSDMPFVQEPSPFWRGSRAWRVSQLYADMSAAVVLLLPLAFHGYAYVLLFRQHGVGNAFVWLSLAATVLLSVLTAAIMTSDVWEPEPADSAETSRPEASQ